MIHVRNPTDARAETVVASEALEVGQLVAVIQGTAKGEPVQVRAATVADIQDDTVVKGIVDYIPDNDLAVDFIIDPTAAGSSGFLALNTEDDNTTDIPSGAACVMWHGRPVVAFDANSVDAALDLGAIREGAKLAFDGDSAKLAAYNGGGVDGTEVFMGVLYRHEGPEITVLFTGL